MKKLRFVSKVGHPKSCYAQVEITKAGRFVGFVGFNHADANKLAEEYAAWKNGRKK